MGRIVIVSFSIFSYSSDSLCSCLIFTYISIAAEIKFAAVQDLCKFGFCRHRDLVVIPFHRSKVAYTKNLLLFFASLLSSLTDERYNTVIRVSLQAPFKSFRTHIQFIERRLILIQIIQFRNVLMERMMHFEIIDQEPVKLLFVSPFHKLREFTAHKEKFLARMRICKSIKRPESGKFFFIRSIHLIDHRTFAVYNLVMRIRQDIILAVGIIHGEYNRSVIIFSEQRIQFHVVQSIMHVTHIPFVNKSQSVRIINIACHFRERS